MALDFSKFGTPVEQSSTLDFSKFGTPVGAQPEKQSAFRQVADLPVGFAKGAVSGVRMIADAFGADSAVSRNLRSAEGYLADLMSAQSKNDQAKIAQIMDAAKDAGVFEQVKSGVQAFLTAPVDLTLNAFGSAAPVIIAGLGAKILGAGAVVGTGVSLLTGGTMGAGTIKGSIYEETKKALLEAKASPEEAERRATLAQQYNGQNLDQILLGTVLGAGASIGPLEKGAAAALARVILGNAAAKEAAESVAEKAAKGAIRQRAEAGAKEALPEFAQAFQEQTAQNIALQREGFDVPTLRGAFGAGTLEALAGLTAGAAIGEGRATPRETKPPAPSVPPTTEGAPSATGPQPPPTGAGVEISAVPPETPGAPGAGGATPPGVDATGTPPPGTAVGAGEQSAALIERLTKEIEALQAENDARKARLEKDIASGANKFEIANRQKKFAETEKLIEGKKNELINLLTDQFLGKGGDNVPPRSAAPRTIEAAAPPTEPPKPPEAVAPPTEPPKPPEAVAPPTEPPKPPEAVAPPATKPTGPTKPTAKSEVEFLDSLGSDDDLPFSVGSAALTKQQQELLAQVEEIGRRYGLVRKESDTFREFRRRVRTAASLEAELEGKPFQEISSKLIAEQEIGETKPYRPSREEREAYEQAAAQFNQEIDSEIKRIFEQTYDEAIADGETGAAAEKAAKKATEGYQDDKLPKYEEIAKNTPEADLARRVYFQNHIRDNTPEEHKRAVTALSDFLAARRQEARARPYATSEDTDEVRAKTSYDQQRQTFGKKTSIGYNFPRWGDLSDESQRLYATINKNDTALEQDLAFRAIKAQIRKEKLEQQNRQRLEEAEAEAVRRTRQEAERAREKQPAGKGEALPQRILVDLMNGDVGSALSYLASNAKGLLGKKASEFFRVKDAKGKVVLKKKGVIVRDSVAQEMFRSLAGVLSRIPNFKVNVVIDDNMVGDYAYGEYDASTNTIFLSERGLDEATLLHELVHAATVKIINQFYVDKSKLSPEAIKAVEHIQNIAKAAKAKLGGKSNAFDDLYEFVAYAMTDFDFQNQLAQIQIPRLATATGKEVNVPQEDVIEREARVIPPPAISSLWDYFTDTLAYLYKLFTPSRRTTKILMPTEKTGVTRKSAEQIEREQARKKPGKTQVSEEPEAVEEDTGGTERQAAPALEDEEEFRSLETAEANVFDAVAESRDEAQIDTLPDELVIERGVTNLRRQILAEPGYRGNLLLEMSAAFQNILAAPEGGIERLAGREGIESTLYSKPQPTTKKAPPSKPSPQLTDEEFVAEALGKKFLLKDKSRAGLLKRFFTQTGYEQIVTNLQNERRIIKTIFDRAERAGMVKRLGKDLNDVWGQITRSIGMALDLDNTHIKPLESALHEQIEAYAKELGVPINEALSRIDIVAKARHEGERRDVKFMVNVPLDNDTSRKFYITGFNDDKGKPLQMTPAGWREYILKEVARADLAPTEDQRKAKAERLRDVLNALTSNETYYDQLELAKAKAASPTLENTVFDRANAQYAVWAGRTPEEVNRLLRLFDTAKHKARIDGILDLMYKLHDKTIELNKQSNYWSVPTENIKNFYGWKSYVPYKGKPGKTSYDEDLEFNTRRIGGELQDRQEAFEGRVSEAENSVLQTLAEAHQSAMRGGRKDLTLAIKNAVADGLLDGKILPEKINFEDRFLGKVDMAKLGGANKIFHYENDGTITIVELKNEREREAIRRSYRTSHPLTDIANLATSSIGQMHTRYNPAFAPMDFVRNVFTNAFTLGTETGPGVAGRVLKSMAAEVASGGLYRSWKFISLYTNGKLAEINRLAGGNAPYNTLNAQQRYYRDLQDYVKAGGKVSYLQGIAAKGALDSLMKDIGQSKLVKTKAQIDKFFDIYNDTFELASRVSAFRAMRDEYVAKGESPDAAQLHSIETTKNLANFEQVGRYGKEMGALFMFFRPAATGAVRAIDALAPAFKFNEQRFSASMKAEMVNGKRKYTDAQVAAAVKSMKEQQKNARIMASSLAGAGAAMFMIAMMLSGDDDEGRNRLLTDDMARWTRYARIFIPGVADPIQIPWGFGPGAFAAAGSQIAALAAGSRMPLTDALSNIATVGLDSFLPLPISRISPVDNFPAFMIDSLLPSIARPFVEYVMNLDGLGREIYNNRQSRYGDAYTGGDNIPELYKAVARSLSKATDGAVDWSPNTMYFFANSYLDGVFKALSSSYNVSLTLVGDKDFDAKNDILIAGSFIGKKSNVDAREFSRAEKYIQDIEKRINSLKSTNPEGFSRYVRAYPEEYALVQYYNQQVNGSLRDLRQYANKLRADENLSTAERKLKIEQAVNMQNAVKRQIMNGFEAISGRKL